MKNKYKVGFTLIEMAVVVSIIIITAGAGFASFTNFNNKQQVETSVANAKTFIRTAQRKAQAGETPHECFNYGASARPLQGYRIHVNGTALYLGANCGTKDNVIEDGDDSDPSNDADVSTKIFGETQQLLLPDGVVFNTNFDVRFWSLYGGTEILGSDTVSISKGAYRYDFSVSSSGEISEGSWIP